MDPIETIDAIFDQLQKQLATMSGNGSAKQTAWDAARRSIKCVALSQHFIDYKVVEVDLENILSSS